MNATTEKIQQIAGIIESNDLLQYSVKSLLTRFATIENQYRYDQVIRNVQQVLEKKMLDNQYAVVSGEELSKIANQFARLGSTENFHSLFGVLLPKTIEQETKESTFLRTRHNYYDEGARTPSKEAQIEIDEFDTLVCEVPKIYSTIFNKKDMKFGHMVNAELISRGQYLVEDELRGLGYTPKVAFTTSNKDTLLFAAAIDTELGKQHFYVPVEMTNNQVLYPTALATDEKIYEFSKEGLNLLLSDRKIEAHNKQRTITAGARDTLFNNTVREIKKDAGFEIDENTSLDKKIAMPKELLPVEEILQNSILRKESQYTDKQVDCAIMLVRNELAKCGYAQTAIKFAGDYKEGIRITASIQSPEGKFDIVVPVEVVSGNQVLFPTKFSPQNRQVEIEITASEYSLSKEGFGKFLISCQESIMPIRYSKETTELDYNSLRKIIHNATKEKRYTTAEQALNVIADKYGEECHTAALQDYKEWLRNASLDYKDNFGFKMRSSVGVKEPGWEGEIVTNQIKLT